MRLHGARAAFASLFFFAIATTAGAARAQGNYRSTPIGGRSALMGGTGIALARDGSAPFLNPATIARIDDTSIAFSVNFYTFETTRFTSFHEPAAVDRGRFGDMQLSNGSLYQNKLDTLPSTFCLFLTLAPAEKLFKGRQKLALCLGNLERQDLEVSSVRFVGSAQGFQANQAQSFLRRWNRFHAGPTFGWYVTDRIAIGASLHGIDTTYTASSQSSSVTIDPQGRPLSSSLEAATHAYSFDLGGIVGITYALDRVYTLGLSASTPPLHIAGAMDATFASQFAGGAFGPGVAAAPAGQLSSLSTATGDFVARAPARVGVGLGAEYDGVKLEADVSYFFPREDATQATLHVQDVVAQNGTVSGGARDVVVTEAARAVLDTAFGIEARLSPGISLLGGVSSDFSAVPRLSNDAPPQIGSVITTRTNRAAASFGVGSRGDGSELLLGAEGSYAWGRTFVANDYVLPNRFALSEQTTFALLFVVAGTTSLDAFKRTVTNLEELVVKRR